MAAKDSLQCMQGTSTTVSRLQPLHVMRLYNSTNGTPSMAVACLPPQGYHTARLNSFLCPHKQDVMQCL